MVALATSMAMAAPGTTDDSPSRVDQQRARLGGRGATLAQPLNAWTRQALVLAEGAAMAGPAQEPHA